MTKAKAGERLPYLLGKLKAPRVLERLQQTAERARAEQWPYEQFLESLLEAEVFARDASGARMRIRHAGFPALKTLEDFDWSAQPSAERPLVLHLAQLSWIEERSNVCFRCRSRRSAHQMYGRNRIRSPEKPSERRGAASRWATAGEASSSSGRSTSQFFGVIRVGRRHSVPRANRADPAR